MENRSKEPYYIWFEPLINRWKGHILWTKDDTDDSPVLYDTDTNTNAHVEALVEVSKIAQLSIEETIKEYENSLVFEHKLSNLWIPDCFRGK